MVKVTVIKFEPIPPPPKTVTIEMDFNTAVELKGLLNGFGGWVWNASPLAMLRNEMSGADIDGYLSRYIAKAQVGLELQERR